MKNIALKKMLLVCAVVACVLTVIGMGGPVAAKSVYLVSDHHASPAPINAYDIGAGGFPLTYQATYEVTSHELGASGLAMFNDPNGDGDLSDAQIFVTYERSNLVEVFRAVDFSYVDTVTAIGARDLAGIVVDQENRLVYTVDRRTKNLYVYVYDADAKTFAPQGTLPIVLSTLGSGGAWGLALDEKRDWLFVTDYSKTVHYFDTNTWTEVGTITTANHFGAIGIAVYYDDNNQTLPIVYTGAAFHIRRDYSLAKYDMTTSTATSVDLSQVVSGMGAMGLAVDLQTNLLYVTTGYYGDDLRVFDSDLNQVYLYPDTEGQILNPAGICIPSGEIGYGGNGLGLKKDDQLADDECVYAGTNITYEICYDNEARDSDAHNVVITDNLPVETSFVTASGGGTYDSNAHAVTWNIGTLEAGVQEQCVQLVVQVDLSTPPGTTITNVCTIDSEETDPKTVRQDTDVCPPSPGNRPEFDAVGCDATNYFAAQDPIKQLVITNAVDSSGKQINFYSDFVPDDLEFFRSTAGQLYPDPCFPNYLSALTDVWNEAVYEWQIVLQMKPESDINLNIVDCVMKHNETDVWTGTEQSGRYRAPWGQLFFVPTANPTLTVEAVPGEFASFGSFYMDAFTGPGLNPLPLVNTPYTSKALWEEGIVMILPETGTTNGSGQTVYNLKQGDAIKVMVSIPGNNTADIRYGKGNVILKYIGIVGTEYLADERCAD